jgi:hypothetical protein
LVKSDIATIEMGSRIRGEGYGRVLHSSRRAVNILLDQSVLTLLNRHGTLSPSTIILDVEEIPAFVWARLSQGLLETDAFSTRLGNPVSLSLEREANLDRQRTIDLLLPYLVERDYGISKAVLHLRGTRVQTTDLERAVMLRQVEALRDSRTILELTSNLLGLGYGLTPSGDDFVLGMIGLMRLMGLDPRALTPIIKGYDNPFPRTILLDAIQGYFSMPVLDVLLALSEPNDGEIDKKVEGLLQVGHSSGSDTLAGMVFFLERGVNMEVKPPHDLARSEGSDNA